MNIKHWLVCKRSSSNACCNNSILDKDPEVSRDQYTWLIVSTSCRTDGSWSSWSLTTCSNISINYIDIGRDQPLQWKSQHPEHYSLVDQSEMKFRIAPLWCRMLDIQLQLQLRHQQGVPTTQKVVPVLPGQSSHYMWWFLEGSWFSEHLQPWQLVQRQQQFPVMQALWCWLLVLVVWNIPIQYWEAEKLLEKRRYFRECRVCKMGEDLLAWRSLRPCMFRRVSRRHSRWPRMRLDLDHLERCFTSNLIMDVSVRVILARADEDVKFVSSCHIHMDAAYGAKFSCHSGSYCCLIVPVLRSIPRWVTWTLTYAVGAFPERLIEGRPVAVATT